jgi:hypothetical protein
MTWDHFTSLKAIIHYFCCSFILVAGFKICSLWWVKSKAIPLHAMVALGGRGVYLLLILGLGTRWGWVVSVTPPPGTHCTRGWVDLRAGLDTEVRGKILCPCLGSNPGRPVRSETLYWLSYPASSCDGYLYNCSPYCGKIDNRRDAGIESDFRSDQCNYSFTVTKLHSLLWQIVY